MICEYRSKRPLIQTTPKSCKRGKTALAVNITLLKRPHHQRVVSVTTYRHETLETILQRFRQQAETEYSEDEDDFSFLKKYKQFIWKGMPISLKESVEKISLDPNLLLALNFPKFPQYRDVTYASSGACSCSFTANDNGKKIILKNHEDISQLKDIFKILRFLHSAKIRYIHKAKRIEKDANGELFVVVTPCDRLFEEVFQSNLFPSEMINFAADLCEGLLSIWTAGYCHRDLVEHNVMTKHGAVKIIGFDLCCPYEVNEAKRDMFDLAILLKEICAVDFACEICEATSDYIMQLTCQACKSTDVMDPQDSLDWLMKQIRDCDMKGVSDEDNHIHMHVDAMRDI